MSRTQEQPHTRCRRLCRNPARPSAHAKHVALCRQESTPDRQKAAAIAFESPLLNPSMYCRTVVIGSVMVITLTPVFVRCLREESGDPPKALHVVARWGDGPQEFGLAPRSHFTPRWTVRSQTIANFGSWPRL